MAIKKATYLILFLFINFGSLAIGSILMADGPNSEWYLNLNKAPWTPPGWVFGTAWFTIMACFSIYLSYLFAIRNSVLVKILFTVQVLLNISWNYWFFNLHLTTIGFITIALLTILIGYFFVTFREQKLNSLRYLLTPYIIWLCIATSLNAYIVLYN